ncbi:Hsp33 family molecular chaperone [Methylocystis sp. MJC1]|jgi:molecular chaperone Hsp33|uniref:Hsp33 family molecular chaperone n=1 Tax=Methylocystis sp. MJC1 TaxID=2654282 RepID=UPI0013ED7377|nr:Hsp33 family molecular chaperone [Methylocystis sp. MJC1]KAF2992056.1 33 kDa chaperonin [Methylocystis sp. MJC1]MBU6525544.1 Hsp33 family molecular chaperone [Methylocystis sp. MJC1]UZX12028.1 Hsp33 family molecular chaperone [Methylocystis sp. MJC1]
MQEAPSRAVSKEARDDRVTPFAVEALDLRGRLVRLGPTVDAILNHYEYPPQVARLLGEAVALAALLGSILESHGRFQLQTRSDGPVDMLVVDYDAPGKLRGFARFDAARLSEIADPAPAALLGRGHLALTIEREEDAARYQGVVPLEGESLAEAAHTYFRQSEQIPSFVRLAVAEVVTPQGRSWRAGGLLLQYLPVAGARVQDLAPGDAPDDGEIAIEEQDDAWTEGQALAGTLEDHELVDPSLSGERLLYRLFHERGVKVFNERALEEFCRCSSERIERLLKSFTPQERADMVGDDGRIGVTCEFCATFRSFDPADFD